MKRYIENFDYRIAEQLLEDIFKRQTATPLKKLDRPIVLYGAGDLGQMAKDFFTNVGVKVEFIMLRASSELIFSKITLFISTSVSKKLIAPKTLYF